MAEDTPGLMNTLGIDRPHMLGGSLGGALLPRSIAPEHPERVNGLVLSGTASRYPPMMRIMVNLTPGFPFLRRKWAAMAKPLFSAPYPPTETTHLNQCLAGANFDWRIYPGAILAPTLIIYMAHDQYVPMKYMQELVEGIKGARLELIDRDHMFFLNQPELMISPALDFLNKVDSHKTGTSVYQ